VNLSRILLGAVALAAACDAGSRAPISQEATPDRTGSVTVADSLYRTGAFEDARSAWRAQLNEAWERSDSAEAARVLTSLGLVARQLGDYDESRRLGLQALDLKLALGLTQELFRSYNALGLLAWTSGDLVEAAEMFDRASAAAAAVRDDMSVAKAAANMALIQNDMGDPYGARRGFAALALASRGAADTVALGRALINMAMLDIRLGDPLPAVATLEEARFLGRVSQDAEAEENALGQLATALSAMGQPQAALAALDTALNLARERGLRRQIAEDLKLLGDLFADAGDHRRALDHYARAQALNEELDLVEESGNVRVNEARSYLALGHTDSAAARARGALAVHGSAGYRAAELDDHLLLAEILASQGDGQGTLLSLGRAAEIAQKLGTPPARARVALVRARILDREERSTEVLEVLDATSDVVARLGESDRWEPDALRARAYARLGHLTAAEAAGRRAVGSIERFRSGYAIGDLRTTLLSARSQVYSDLVVILIRQGKTAEAFEVADAARGRALLDHLAAARRDIERTSRSAGKLLESDRLLRQIEALTAQLRDLDGIPPQERGAPHEASERFLVNRLAEARRQYEARLAVTAASPDLALLGATGVETSTIQEALRADEAIVEYLTSNSETHVFVIRPHRIAHAVLPASREDLANRVRLTRALLSRSGVERPVESVLRALYDDLMQPVLGTGALDGARRLIVVPHGPLVYVPFAALMDPTGRYAVTEFDLAVLPAAAALPALRTRAGSRPASAVSDALALAPMPDLLPATGREVTGVRSALGGRALFGAQASELAVRRGLQQARVVHIATHGSMNQVNPMFSSIELARSSGGDPDDDGRLEVHELLGLQVSSDLVFLSGCETGMGNSWATLFDRTEDYATLAQGFLYGGAGSVVATLWRVDDEASAAVAEAFYGAWKDHADPVAALAEAQRSLLADDRYSAPYFWAGYQVLGVGGAVK